MPLPNIVKAAFPNVPNLPGVPSIPRSPNFPPAVQSVLGLAEGKLWQAIKGHPNWGIFYTGTTTPVAYPDSMLDMNYRNESKVSSFPVQDGAFANYNKVANPYNIKVRLVKGGSEQQRATFLSALESIANSLNLVDVTTPERTYINANITGLDYRRSTENGANILIVELSLIEIRQVSVQYSATAPNPAQPSGADPKNNGKVQPQAPSVSFARQATNYLGITH